MRRRPALLLAFALTLTLAGLAGCNGVFGDGTDRTTPTVTPVPVGNGTPSGSSVVTTARDLPPGLSRSGIESLGRLVTAHERALANRTFRERMRIRQVRDANETVGHIRRTSWVVDGAVVRRDARYDLTSVLNTSIVYRAFYHNGTHSIRYTRRANGSDAVSVRATSSRLRADGSEISYYLDVNRSRVRPRQDGTVRVVGFGAGENIVDSLPSSDSVSAYRVVAIVEPSGFVRSLTVRMNGTANGRPFERTVRIRYAVRDSLSVPKPDWLNRTTSDGTPATTAETSTESRNVTDSPD